MSELSLRSLVKIYPYTVVNKSIFGRKKAQEALAREKSQPYTTNEGVVAVQDFSLDVKDGEFIVLLGPSGCGKTSILRMIAGLEDVSSGDVIMDGKVINYLKPEERDIAMIFQNYSLYPSFTVYENLAYPLKMQHVPREKIDEAVNEMAELLELTELLHRQPSELSGGQSQRVAIGRALVRKPKLFLMDEPFSNLDINMRRKLRMELRSLNKKLGITFIYVTHDQPEAFMLGDRVVVLHDGITEQIGTPQELYTKPKNMYVASFIGSPQMNFIENVPITSSENGLSVTVLGKTLPLPDKMTAALSKESGGKNVTLGVRPVHVTPSNEGIDAVVDYVDTVEAELHIHASVGKIKFVSIIPATAASTYMRGENIKLSIDANKIHLFDPETGERIN